MPGGRGTAPQPGGQADRALLRPRVVASACLGFDACRWDGAVLADTFLRSLAAHAEVVRVCPEVAIGLGVPRDPIRIERTAAGRRLVQPATGRDVTRAMEDFAAAWLDRLGEVDGFVLKGRSPSCAVSDAKVYAGGGKQVRRAGKGPGLFAQAVLARFPAAAVEDEGRLTNRRLREHFLTRIFTTAAFRAVRRRGRMRDLVAFQADNKLLFMALGQTRMRRMGRLVANAEGRAPEEVYDRYEEELTALLARPSRPAAHVNVAMHALGHFKDGLTGREKKHFLDVLARYRAGAVEPSAVTGILASWVARFEVGILARQTWFEPFPAELVDPRDSARRRTAHPK